MKKIFLLSFIFLFILNSHAKAIENDKNLINNEKNDKELKFSYLRGYEPKNLNIQLIKYDDGIKLYNNYFKYKLVRSDFDVSAINIEKNITKNSLNFVKAGGAEYITATYNDKSASALVKNQADWFLIDADGMWENPIAQAVGYLSIRPTDFFIEGEENENDVSNDLWLKKYKNPSYLEGVKVLILDFCYSLKWPRHAKAWLKVLPNGLILGYNNYVSPWMTNYIFEEFGAVLNNSDKKLTEKEIGEMWLNLHCLYDSGNSCIDTSMFATYILKKEYWSIEYEPNFFWQYEKALKSKSIDID